MSVGELLAEIDLEQGSVVEAAAQLVDGKEWLDLLVQHSAATVAPDDPDDWRMLAGVLNVVGGHASASAAWHALNLGIDVLTRRPERYDHMDGPSEGYESAVSMC